MPGTLYGYPFDEELFIYHWLNEPDPVKTAFLDSGVMAENGEIANQISNGGNLYTIPFYKTIGGTELNYDGKTDITATETEGASQSGVVFGRAAAWTARDFIIDFNSGANPWVQIAGQTARWKQKQEQARAIKIAEAALSTTLTRETEWADSLANHVTDISAADSSTVADSNKLSATTLGDAVVKACGDNAPGLFNLAIMHSQVARNLKNLDLLEFRKYTDPNGIQRQLPIADMDGMQVIVDDACIADGKYTTYLLGNGFLQHASAPVQHPAEYDRDPYKNGGQDTLIIRYREAIQPNGFSWTGTTETSPTDDQLGTASNYTAIFDPKSIGAVKVVSNG